MRVIEIVAPAIIDQFDNRVLFGMAQQDELLRRHKAARYIAPRQKMHLGTIPKLRHEGIQEAVHRPERALPRSIARGPALRRSADIELARQGNIFVNDYRL